ncbi:MAG TPA: C39 family peptidase [Alphaproteobacteria bacterium]
MTVRTQSRVHPLRLLAASVGAVCMLILSTPVRSGEMQVSDAAGTYNIRLTTFKERQLLRTIRQQYDFSCGSAALATMLTHHYGRPTTEPEVFRDMWERGDQARIRKEGFSLLDMKNYLERRGLRANAFRAPLDKLQKAGVPAITLVRSGNLAHFVVVKGIDSDRVLLGDPFVGTRVVNRADFEQAWNGVVFVIIDEAERGQASFNRAEDWAVRPRAPLQAAGGGSSLAGFLLQLPGRNFF